MFSTQTKNLVDRFKEKLPNSNFKRWERDLYDLLVLETDFLPSNAPVGQRLWHVEYNTTSIPTCLVCNSNWVTWNAEERTYRKYCSSTCSTKSDDLKSKRKKTMQSRYGVEYYTQSPDFNGKRKKSYRQKYNTDWSLQNENIRNQIKQTNIKKYGVPVYTQSDDYKSKNSKTLNALGLKSTSQMRISDESLEKLNDKNWLIDQHHTKEHTITKIAEILGVDGTTVANRLRTFNIPLIRFSSSQGHKEIIEFIKEIFPGEVSINAREVLPSKKELDIYIPSKNLAIEFCGLYWHSADIHNRITKAYHKEKYQECAQQNITLLTIFEDEWQVKQDIVKSIIRHKLNISSLPYLGARTTTCCLISAQEAKEFLEKYHIQGNGPGSLMYGLRHNSNLVAVCKVIERKGELIINRYATSAVVRGGFSKILNHIVQHHKKPITTFADLRWSNGDVYIKSGFKVEKVLPPDYMYVSKGNRIHKFNFRHSRLVKMLPNYDPQKTEVENCLEFGLYRVWDCGKVKFKLGKRFTDG
jgi:hypothetical protein